jgi:hypothetical protein
VEGAAPDYPAAAARLFNSSCKKEETLAASCPSDGEQVASSGIRAVARKVHEYLCRLCVFEHNPGAGVPSAIAADLPARTPCGPRTPLAEIDRLQPAG